MATAQISVALPTDIIDELTQAVETGEYASASEVVEQALRAWKITHKDACDNQYLRQAWAEAIADDTPGIPLEQVFDPLTRRYDSSPENSPQSRK